jgi:catechol 2,3-dioxygenase
MPMAIPTQSPELVSIHPDTVLGTVRLIVSDLARSREFYERVLGLQASELQDDRIALGAGGRPLVELTEGGSAAKLHRRAPGLYHLAILVPSRQDLAFALARLANARWPLDGASDHLVSEALYLSDPDGNGIEIYRDRPREQWRRSGDQLQMATMALDLDALAAELPPSRELQRLAPVDTRIGHVHLQVSDIREAEAFYSALLGFEVMVRAYPGALFVSAGGYHHHIGLNTWHSAGAAAPPPGSLGLRNFEVVLPNAVELHRVLHRVRAAGIDVEATDAGALVRDPSGTGVMLRAG